MVPIHLLHLSDTHLDGDARSAARLRQVLAVPPSRRPDAIVVTGDIADHGESGEYRMFGEVLAAAAPETPWLAVPGNHDDPDTLRALLRQDVCPVLDVGGVRVVGLDVTVPGADHGFLRGDTARLVTDRTDGAARVVLALHQPPVATGHAVADTMLLTNPGELTKLVRDLPPVVAILSGHVHTPLASTLDGTPVLGAGGVASTLALDPERRPIAVHDAPPGAALHRISDDGTVTTTFHHGV